MTDNKYPAAPPARRCPDPRAASEKFDLQKTYCLQPPEANQVFVNLVAPTVDGDWIFCTYRSLPS
jgi:hypothetical protein